MTVLGVILAGGRGRRMGGADKALLTLAGETLAARAARRLGPQVAAQALSANGDPARFAALGLPVLPDPMPDRPGPLAGLLAGLDAAAARGFPLVATVAVDTPFFPADLVARLAFAREAAGARLAIAVSGDRSHPTFALVETGLRGALRAALVAGMRRVMEWAAAEGAATADFGSATPDPFFNVNTPDDRDAAEARAAGDGA